MLQVSVSSLQHRQTHALATDSRFYLCRSMLRTAPAGLTKPLAFSAQNHTRLPQFAVLTGWFAANLMLRSKTVQRLIAPKAVPSSIGGGATAASDNIISAAASGGFERRAPTPTRPLLLTPEAGRDLPSGRSSRRSPGAGGQTLACQNSIDTQTARSCAVVKRVLPLILSTVVLWVGMLTVSRPGQMTATWLGHCKPPVRLAA
eukprot:SAG22_NODE_62_length_23371_cov_84.500602_8_plen_203_part_00